MSDAMPSTKQARKAAYLDFYVSPQVLLSIVMKLPDIYIYIFAMLLAPQTQIL